MKKQMKKSSVPRSLPDDVATCVDNIGSVGILPNTMYYSTNIALTNSFRAKTIAQAYQFYRITKVEFKWKPLLDTFSSAANITVPQLYFRIDKANTLPMGYTTLDSLKRSGCKPRRLDDKNLTVSFAPAVHLGSDEQAPSGPATVVETAAVYKVSPWLTTNANAGGQAAWAPNSVDHRGLVWYIEQSASQSAPNNVAASLDVIVHYEFKQPQWSIPGPTDFVGGYQLDLDQEDGDKPVLLEAPA